MTGPPPDGKEETFNYAHSSLRNVIERSFGVLKMKWRILRQIPSFEPRKQSKIILACCALHNFIREAGIEDRHFEKCSAGQYFVSPEGGEEPDEEEQEEAAADASEAIAHLLCCTVHDAFVYHSSCTLAFVCFHIFCLLRRLVHMQTCRLSG
jgi:hypothetical protein